jgi:hypothetical protein
MANSAGIIVYNADNNTVLVGTERAGYDFTGYGRPAKPKSINVFITELAARGIPTAGAPVLLNARFPGINLNNNFVAECEARGLLPIHMIQIMFPPAVLNPPGGPEFHIVDEDGVKCAVSTIGAQNPGYPKGAYKASDTHLVETALREFQEETGFNLRPILGGGAAGALPLPVVGALTDNQIYNIGLHNSYQFYFIQIRTATATAILAAYNGGHRYYSELFNLQFVQPANPVNGACTPVKNYMIESILLNILPAAGGAAQGGGQINYKQKLQKYKQKLLERFVF